MYSLNEFRKLEMYLKDKGYNYKRESRETESFCRNVLIVFDENGERIWSAACSWNKPYAPITYGAKDGLLEVWGTVSSYIDDFDGFLTADDIINRLKNPDFEKHDYSLLIEEEEEEEDEEEEEKEDKDFETIKKLVGEGIKITIKETTYTIEH